MWLSPLLSFKKLSPYLLEHLFLWCFASCFRSLFGFSNINALAKFTICLNTYLHEFVIVPANTSWAFGGRMEARFLFEKHPPSLKATEFKVILRKITVLCSEITVWWLFYAMRIFSYKNGLKVVPLFNLSTSPFLVPWWCVISKPYLAGDTRVVKTRGY